MVFSQPLEDIVPRRYSVRTYLKKRVPEEIKAQILSFTGTLESPFPAKPSFRLVETELEPNGAKLGTYGMIKGAALFCRLDRTGCALCRRSPWLRI